ncbi:V-set domain-containing T-cell activation inhibitor 1-like [Bombina bombina]|uniref:V-set domain-containing T-cell activation inhibitor 1-like n=1 Tax=Bombina bombina TaxID=8345 RepID=UPI00235AAE35|nr:V-set domain-containing T-cell activation inhibitor 1-like [Bombina bombina]
MGIGKIIFRIMIAIIILLLFILALIIGIGIAGKNGLTVTVDYSVGLIGEDGILKCSFPPDVKVTTDIQWEKDGVSGTVYKYANGQNDLAGQNAAYKGRTALFPTQLVTGNASLKLTKVKLSDAGLYKCIITNSNGRGEAKLSFKVGAFSPLSVTNTSLKTLHCESSQWYPQPKVTWLNATSGETIANSSSTTYEPGLNSMVKVVSDLINVSMNTQYACIIQNELAKAEGDALLTASSFTAQTRLEELSSAYSVTSPLVLSCVLSLACLFVPTLH